jgi:hypothetical protein
VVARGDGEEALTRLDHVPDGSWCGPTRERSECLRAGDPVRREPAAGLVATKRHGRRLGEAAVDRTPAQPVPPHSKLEHGDVPADRAHSELTLAEQRPAAAAECTTRLPTHEAGRANVVRALKGHERVGGQLTAHSVDRTRVEPVGAKPDLEGGDPSAGGEPAGSERQDANGHRDAGDGEATHGRLFALSRAVPLARAGPKPRLQSGRCLPR